MKSLAFQKWEATGNDFYFVDARAEGVSKSDIPRSDVVSLCRRTEHGGADGVILYTAPVSESTTGTMLVLNSDGSEGGMCGNALRCLAKILQEQTGEHSHTISLAGRKVQLLSEPGTQPSVSMGQAGAIEGTQVLEEAPTLAAIVGFKGYLLSFGNPHFVVPVDQLPTDWIERGSAVQEEAHKLLGSGGINCGFVETNPDANGVHKLRVFERGAGPTQSCGSGACAASAVLERVFHKAPAHRLALSGGILRIGREDKGFTLQGPANLEYRGNWELSS